MHRRSGAPKLASVIAIVALLLAAPASPAQAANIHVDCSQHGLQPAINNATAGSTLLISGTCVGNFTLGKSLTLEGSPHATLDGDQTGTTLTITTTKPVQLLNLTIQRGLATKGGGLHALGGALTLSDVIVQDSYAIGDLAQGGGIWKKGGTLSITASQIVHDVAFTQSHQPITNAQGGGIFMPGGKLTITGSTVAHDQVICHTPGQCQAFGGGIDYEGKTVETTVTNSHIDDNRAVATGNIAVPVGAGVYLLASFTIAGSTLNGNVNQGTAVGADSQAVAYAVALAGAGPPATGSISHTVISGNQVTLASKGSGATATVIGVAVSFGGSLQVTSSKITGNRASVTTAGSGNADGAGFDVGPAVLTDSTISSNTISVHAGTGDATISGGGFASGGGTVTFVRSTVSANHLSATSDSGNATAAGGGITAANGTFTLRGSTVNSNTSHAVAPGATGSAHAGGVRVINSSGNAVFVNSTIALNSATSTGSSAFAAGGGIEAADSTVVITNVTIASNHSSERGGGLLAAGSGSVTLQATILAANTAPAGPDCRGSVASAGHNLISNRSGCTFTAKSSDKLNHPAALGPLQNNGGSTLTMAVKANSPALDAIPKDACAVTIDQRGVKRPQGSGCEIGAFERQ